MKNTRFRTIILAASVAVSGACLSQGALIISGVMDGPLSGGTPKAVELYATAAIADASTWTVDYFFNANATSSSTLTLSGAIAAGTYITITPNVSEFTTWFGSAPTIDGGGSINGDDSIVLSNSATVIDTYGSPGTDGTGEAWEYMDGWAYRKDNTGPSATFDINDWILSGTNALDGETTNATATTPVPFGTYAVPEPSSALLGAVGALALLRRRR